MNVLIIICNIPLGRFIFRINKAVQNLNCRLHDYNCILPMSAGKNITADSTQKSQDQTIIQCQNQKWIKNVNYTLLCNYTLKFYDNIFFLYFFFVSCHEKEQKSSILTILKDKTLNILQQEIIGFGWRIFFEILLSILSLYLIISDNYFCEMSDIENMDYEEEVTLKSPASETEEYDRDFPLFSELHGKQVGQGFIDDSLLDMD